MNDKVLIVEDEAKLREVLCDYFRSKGEIPVEAADGLQALSERHGNHSFPMDTVWRVICKNTTNLRLQKIFSAQLQGVTIGNLVLASISHCGPGRNFNSVTTA